MKRIRPKKDLLSERFPGHRIIPAGEFKPACLKLMDQVNATGVEIVITKPNEPVAKLVPISGALRPFVGRDSDRGRGSACPDRRGLGGRC